MSRILRCDLHLHTNYSFDSSVTMEQYAKKAIERGIDVVCFTDHIDRNRHYDTFVDFQFDRRKKEFERLKAQFAGQVELLLGFEIGEPHLHPEVMQAVCACEPDMIIGSVHYPADYEQEGKRFDKREYEKLYNRYVREMVQCGGFDMLGHVDLPKRYLDSAELPQNLLPNYLENFHYICETLRLCAEKGIVPEINTSSLRSVADTMPSLNALEYYAKSGGKYVTINSDSHNVDELGYGYEQTYANLPHNLQTCYFVGRKLKVAETE